MAYIGRSTDKISNVEVLDNITFDGSSSYTLQKNSVNFTPSSANTLLVSIDGVVQAGNFTVSGSTIDFGTAVAGTSTCDFILHYGVGLITTPADGTVTNDKINYPLAQSGAVVSSFNRTSSDGNILELQKDGTVVGSIGNKGANIFMTNNSSNNTGFKINPDAITPSTSTGTDRDNAIDLGASGSAYKDLYLGGGLYVGGTGTANKLDDYEEGTWTPASTFANDTASNQVGKYTKIGNVVIASFQITFSTTSFGVTTSVSGLPFTATNTPSGIGIGGAMIKGYYTGTSTNLSGYVGDGGTQINLYENSTHLPHSSDKILGKNLRATVVYQTN